MQKLFVDFEFSDKIVLDEEQSRHIAKSLRMRKGDMLTVCNGNGTDYGCMIDEITKTTVTLSVCYKQACESEPSVKVSLYQGVPKGDKMEDIIQKCVELGIFSITPVLTKRSISRPDEKQAAKKQQRYAKIALEAAQQSGRGIVPEINKMVDLMCKSGKINDKEEYKKRVFAREEEGSTGIGEGIAIPHAKCDAVSKPGLAAMVVKGGVDFDALDGEPVSLIFLIAAPNKTRPV